VAHFLYLITYRVATAGLTLSSSPHPSVLDGLFNLILPPNASRDLEVAKPISRRRSAPGAHHLTPPSMSMYSGRDGPLHMPSAFAGAPSTLAADPLPADHMGGHRACQGPRRELPGANSNRGLESDYIQTPRASHLPLLVPENKQLLTGDRYSLRRRTRARAPMTTGASPRRSHQQSAVVFHPGAPEAMLIPIRTP
jgi:hypothetical protein